MRRESHSLKGASGYLAADALEQAATALNEAAQTADSPAQLASLISAVEKEHKRVVVELERYRVEEGASRADD